MTDGAKPISPTAAELAGPVTQTPQRRRRRMSTGNLLFVVLTIALAPVGAIAFGAGARTILTSDTERELLLQVAVSEKAGRLATIFDADATRLAQALTSSRKAAQLEAAERADAAVEGMVLPAAPSPPPDDTAATCQAVARAFPGGENRVSAQLVDRTTGTNLCVSGVPAVAPAAGLGAGAIAIDTRGGMLVYAVSPVGRRGRVILTYPVSLVQALVGNDARLPAHSASIAARGQRLAIADAIGDVPQLLRLESSASVGQSGMQLILATSRSWFNTAEMIGLLTPLGMWLLAALLSWLVIDRILLTPIQRLERSMARYRPGDRLDAPRSGFFAAQEVETLQSTIEGLTRNVAVDKAALAEGLDAQRALTREVHHRVKNNLQIIASLISLHSRDAKGQADVAAYLAIQRRVDALAVVHRHLHADTESRGGIALATILGELSVGLRHSLTSEYGPVTITTAIDPAQASQDVALTIAFFVTELVELACLCDAQAPVAVTMHVQPMVGATLHIASTALRFHLEEVGEELISYERVLTGLSRQLRQPLRHDPVSGRYSIDVPVLDPGAISHPDSAP